MKFKCSQRESISEEVLRLRDWHPIFAFVPHRTNEGVCVWLEKIYRRYPRAWVGTVYGNRLYCETPEYRLRFPLGHSQASSNV